MTDKEKTMNNRLVPPSEYNQVMINCINTVKYRMDYTCTPYQDDDIAVFDTDVFIYVLANPYLGEEPIFDEAGFFVGTVPMYNITAKFKMPSRPETSGDSIIHKTNFTGVRIMRPDLCMRIDKQSMTVVND